MPAEIRLEAMQAALVLMVDENRDVLQSLLLFLSDIAQYASEHQVSIFKQLPTIYDSCLQGSHTLEKYLNLEGFLEKSLKIKYALKSTGKLHKGLEKSLNSSIFCRNLH